jgi:membrane fusion protein (multidrug efflux system)
VEPAARQEPAEPTETVRRGAFDAVGKPLIPLERHPVHLATAWYKAGRRVGRVTLSNRFWALVLLAVVACKKEEQQKAAPPPPLVKVAEVTQRDVPIYVEAIGQTRGSTEVEISARVEGFLETMSFKEGTFVKKGQVLYTIDNKPFKAALAQSQADLAKAEAELVRTEQDVKRYEPLVAKNAVSVQEFETAQANARAQKSAVAAARASVEKARIELGYTTVTAPDEGLIGITEVHPGTLVGRGANTLLTRLSQVEPIHVRFSISEREYLFYARRREERDNAATAPDAGVQKASARAGDAAHAGVDEGVRGLTFKLILADGTTHAHEGHLVFVDRNVDPKTGTIRLEAAFPNPGGIVRPGQYARVRAAVSTKKNAVIIGQRSVQEMQGINNVAVVKPDDTVEIRPVRTAERVGALVVIESGLKAGERVIVEGIQKVRAGIKVKAETVPLEELSAVASSAAPPGAPASPAPAASAP